jgi:hypothetical protein
MQFSELWRENSSIIDSEIDQMTGWLHSSGVDLDFDPDTHVYTETNGDRTFSLPELTSSQLFALSMILSSSEIVLDTQPRRFATPPNQD